MNAATQKITLQGRAGAIEALGYTRSDRAVSHGRPKREWRGVQR